jgi:hypothetical protein
MRAKGNRSNHLVSVGVVAVRRLIAVFACLWGTTTIGCARPLPDVRDGDVIFQISGSSQSVAIQQATHSKYSHVGIVFIREGQPYVLEASATVHYTRLKDWIVHGVHGGYVVKRLRNGIAAKQAERLRGVAQTFLGRPYDPSFEWSDSRIYCSELVWKIYDRALGVRLGELQHLRDFDLSAPVVRVKLKERYGDAPPLDEPVISPAAMFSSPMLVAVARD